MKPVFLSIRGKVFAFCRRVNTGAKRWGWCSQPTDGSPKGEIVINSRLRGRNELVITLHEMLHAAFWDIDEGVIDSASCDLGRALWALGYRRIG